MCGINTVDHESPALAQHLTLIQFHAESKSCRLLKSLLQKVKAGEES